MPRLWILCLPGLLLVLGLAPVHWGPWVSQSFVGHFKGILDAHVYFHNLYNTGNFIQAADVLFVGDSRLITAFNHQGLSPFFNARHLKYYNLGLARAGGNSFYEVLMTKLNLRPRYILVGADFFFTDYDISRARVLNETRFDAFNFIWRKNITFHARRLQSLIFRDGQVPAVHRRIEDGTIFHHLISKREDIFRLAFEKSRQGFPWATSLSPGGW